MPSSTVKKLGASLKSFIGIKRGRVRVKCPATSANLGAGFDICGVALQEPFDVMTVSLSKNSGCTVSTAEKSRYSVPSDFACNTCGPVYEKMRAEFGLSPSVDVVIEKNIKPGSGLGSSAASAAGMAFALNELFRLRLSQEQLVLFASVGEAVSAGAPHLDNVSPAIMGGFTLTYSYDPIRIMRVSPPSDLEAFVVMPDKEKGSTKYARSVLPDIIPRTDANHNLRTLASLISGIVQRDSGLIVNSLDDRIVEPARAKAGILHNLLEVKRIASRYGYGAVASGAGPSLVCFGKKSNSEKQRFEAAVRDCFGSSGIGASCWWTAPSSSGVSLL